MRRIALAFDDSAFVSRIANQIVGVIANFAGKRLSKICDGVSAVIVFSDQLVRFLCRYQLAPDFNRLRTSFAPPLRCITPLYNGSG